VVLLDIVDGILDGNFDSTSEDIFYLNRRVSEYYFDKPNIVSIPKEDVIFVGDLHGELEQLLRIKRIFLKSDSYFVFLGDYADRGPSQIETTNLVFSLLLKYPYRVTLLRGNHESESVASRYGFRDAVERKYSHELFESYCDVFSTLPLVANNAGFIFACHGGVPRNVTSIDQIKKIDRFHREFEDPISFQLVWNDPSEGDFQFSPSMRGGRALVFGETAFNDFMDALNYKIMIRAHEAYREGVNFFFNDRLISVFSASYRGQVTPRILHIGKNLKTNPINL
jgi:diadenosine tetraphosphatase ApaH/serine/threonine PP2A family protein phosphatase